MDLFLQGLSVPVELSFVGKYELLDGSSDDNTQDNMAVVSGLSSRSITNFALYCLIQK